MNAAPSTVVLSPRRSGLLRLLARWWPLLLAPTSLALISSAKNNPAMVERLYSSGIYLSIAKTLGFITSLFPFSIAELGGAAIIISAVVLVFRAIFKGARLISHELLRPERPRAKRLAGVAAGILLRWIGFLSRLSSVVLFIFVVSCGLNYYRPEFASICGLDVRPSPTDELELLCAELAGRANALREQLPEDENGVASATYTFGDAARLARESFGQLSEDFPSLPDMPITPKPIANSWIMSRLQLTGVFTFITYESNINYSAPAYSLPATMCHELAHTRGFMREDEANFIGYLACEKSSLPEFTYSGVMLALVHAENRLYSADPEAFARVDALLSDAVRRDFSYNNSYWAQFEGPAAKVSEAVNGAYLKANNQSDGIRSYGRMVDLLLADYRARHDLD